MAGRALAAIILLGALFAPNVARAAATTIFPRPAALEPNVQFWVNVFTYYSYRDFVLIDRDQVWKVYQVLQVPGEGPPTADDVRWADSYLKAKYTAILNRLASGNEPVGYEERHVAEMFKGEPLSHYAAAADNLRMQQGLQERFREALLRSRNYKPTMERVFRASGLPVELAVLASVESGYYVGSKSSAGAVGMWQFTRSTGKQYLRITRRVDERLNPFRSTEAAARLLQYNYDTLGSWPLAITAYNYGTWGMARASEENGNDFVQVLKNFNGPHFGFASKNYYAEFLAALQVHRYEDLYFPGIADQPTPAPQPIREVIAAPRSRRRASHSSKHAAKIKTLVPQKQSKSRSTQKKQTAASTQPAKS